jgi:hypothetical protein
MARKARIDRTDGGEGAVYDPLKGLTVLWWEGLEPKPRMGSWPQYVAEREARKATGAWITSAYLPYRPLGQFEPMMYELDETGHSLAPAKEGDGE